MAPWAMSSLALAQRTELVRCAPICTCGGFFVRGHHGEAVGGIVRHGFFAVDIFAGGERVHNHLLMPVVGHGDEDGVDVFRVEQFLVAARSADVFAGNFLRQVVAAVVEIGGGHAFDARKLDSGRKHATAFHAHADHAEADAVVGARERSAARQGSASSSVGRRRRWPGDNGSGAQERTAREDILGHLCGVHFRGGARFPRADT